MLISSFLVVSIFAQHRGLLVLGDELNPDWTLWYSEDFSTPLNDATAAWSLDDYSEPFDTIMDDAGLYWANDYGPDGIAALNSFSTYRKEFPVGQDGWLTASLSARDWDNDGVIEDPPTLTTKQLSDGSFVAEMNVPDHTGGVIFRNSLPLPSEYRIEYKLKTIDFGGKRGGEIEYDNRINGYSTESPEAGNCKTQFPWNEASRSGLWSGDASIPYCEWNGVREGPVAYNGFHFLSIVDVDDPAPRNNHFWHIRRKVQIEMFSQHPDRVGDESGGRVCNSNTKEYYDFSESSFNVVNMYMSGLPSWIRGEGQLTSTRSYFMTTCSDGVAESGIISTAAELQPELMPNEYYTFAIERNSTGYTLEAEGNFARVGNKKLRFYRPFIVDDVPIWHYNSDPSEYDGQYNNDLVQEADFGSTTWPNLWPAGSAYPDSFVIGDVYTNVYEGKASLTDIKLYGLAADAPPTISPTTAPVPPTVSPSQEPPNNAAPTDTPPMNTNTGISACDPTRDCDKDSDCAEGFVCADAHKSELKAQGFDSRHANCEIISGNVVNEKWEVCFDPAILPQIDAPLTNNGITACDPTRDCDNDIDCAEGLVCADEHKSELKALELDSRLADCEIDSGSILNDKWEVCFDPAILP